MSDINERLRVLDEVREPDLWSSITAGTPTRSISFEEPTIRKRILVAALAMVLTIAAVTSVIRWAGSGSPRRVHPAGHRVLVSGVSKDGTLRCTASFPSDELQPGLPIGVRFTLTNLSGRRVSYGAFSEGSVVVKGSSGKILWDPRIPASLLLGPGPRPPLRLPPGMTATIPASGPRIWWSGRLTLHLSCLGVSLGSVPVRVSEPGRAPSPQEALDRAIDRTGGLFDRCRPAPDGSWTHGSMRPPDGADIPALRVRCSAQIVRQPGFDTVSIYFISPPDAPAIEFPDTIYQLSNFESLPGNGSIEAGRWLFVVTNNAVREVSGPEYVFRMAGGTAMAPEYVFYKGKWSAGGISCEGRGSGMGGGVVFISVCAR